MVLRSVLCLLPALGLLVACVGAPASPNLTSTELNLYGFSEYVPVDLMASFKQATGWCAGPQRRYGW
ncbi:MAG TPA: hypothetical protein VEC93_22915 [Anaerolineae bacterium]|nr:hypothetical protein [Anaerolineae bacterium]